MRRAKIVCTLGPRHRLVRPDQGPGRSRNGRGPLQPQPRLATPSTRTATSGCARPPTRPVAASASWSTFKARRSGSARFREGPVLLERGDEFTITVERRRGRPQYLRHHLPGPRRATSAPASASWSTTAGSPSRSPTSTGPGCTPWSSRAAWSPTTRASTSPASRSPSPRSPTRTSRTCAGACASAPTSSRCPSSAAAQDIDDVHADHGRRRGAGCPVIAKVEKPQAVEQPRRDRRRLRRHHGRPRRPRRRDAAGSGPDGAEARDQARQAQRQAGHRRHPDARLDDRQLPPHPRRGLRRRQRRHRRHRRGDALRRDQRRQVPGRDGPDDGPHRRGRRGGHPRARACRR